MDTLVARLAARRHGVFSFQEAARLGATRRIVQYRLSTGRWQRLYDGIYRLAGAPETWRQRLLAGCLACGDGAAASHRSAAALRVLAGFAPGVVEITVPRGRRPRPRNVVIHQSPLPKVDVQIVDAIPVTTPARTLLDLASAVSADTLEEALDDALRRGLVTVPRLRWRLDELGRRPGATRMRRLLRARTEEGATPRSVLERRFRRVLTRGGLPTPIPQYEVRDRGRVIGIVDYAYPDDRVAIEVDGYRWHSGRRKWQLDLTRRNEITQRGWRVIHVTDDDLKQRSQATAAMIAEALGDP